MRGPVGVPGSLSQGRSESAELGAQGRSRREGLYLEHVFGHWNCMVFKLPLGLPLSQRASLLEGVVGLAPQHHPLQNAHFPWPEPLAGAWELFPEASPCPPSSSLCPTFFFLSFSSLSTPRS